MKKLIAPNDEILRMVSQNVPLTETMFKRSQFVIPFYFDGIKVYFNTLTKEGYLMEGDEDMPESILFESGNDIFGKLIKNRFYVRSEVDEIKSYCGFLSVLRTVKYSQNIKSFTILPTTHCNARCFYCFENDLRLVSMTDKTAIETVDLIERTRGNNKVRLSWFGGEPLMGIHSIRKITSMLKERNIPFKSEMISNGSLFTKALIKEAKENWNLEKVQITLDGDKEEYLKRKNYLRCDDSIFDRVLENLNLLLKENIKVPLRLNIDRNNLESFAKLAERLNHNINDKTGIMIIPEVLFQEQSGAMSIELWKEALRIANFFREKGFQTVLEYEYDFAKPYFCMADHPGSIVVNADGTLYNCEQCIEESKVCNIKDFVFKSTKKTAAVSDIQEKCMNCPFLPICTEFSNCPNQQNNCRGIRLLKLEDSLKIKLHSFLQNQNS